jgi:hypothetical protein
VTVLLTTIAITHVLLLAVAVAATRVLAQIRDRLPDDEEQEFS